MTVIGGPGVELDDEEVAAFVRRELEGLDVDGKRVCLVVPDATRSCPLPLLVRELHAALVDRVAGLTAVVALGTHAAMTDEQLDAHLGAPYPGLVVVNHEWWEPGTFVSLGTISSERVKQLSEGRLEQAVDVRINRHVTESDVVILVGPVFPHEVVGFSGGNKYLFPGVAGPEVIDLSHWLGALISSADIIGTRGTTPVRALIDEAAALVPARRLAL
ncbi:MULTISPECIES: lactate racemase domain-containing protein [unclassified Nocardioides]|uniref:lactate racemase domain-containing protein n=1 Tax=unclassified Nocardioides TaxID=2615069 RepID=UPI000A5B77CF|nr:MULTISPECIES: lactate racemase domain-containing protein [unclassified Nocardioides]